MNHSDDFDKSELSDASAQPQKCGLVMPISPIDGYQSNHWLEVKAILADAARIAGLEASLVSDADVVGVIHSRIVTNLFQWPMVICDVSTRNPNVMFELGMRLTFDKPVVIVVDNKTTMPFDINAIEYLKYPADLRYSVISQFKEDLASKLRATQRASIEGMAPSFLKHYKITKAPSLKTEQMSAETKVILDSINEIKEAIQRQVLPKAPFRLPSPTEAALRHRKLYQDAQSFASSRASGMGYAIDLDVLAREIQEEFPNEFSNELALHYASEAIKKLKLP